LLTTLLGNALSRTARALSLRAFELQPHKRRLLKDGARFHCARTFDLLVALADCAGHLVTKYELLNQVWPKTVVEEAALHAQVSAPSHAGCAIRLLLKSVTGRCGSFAHCRIFESSRSAAILLRSAVGVRR